MEQEKSGNEATATLSWKKKLLFLAVIYAAFVVVFEIGARLVFFATDNLNPYYITFGFVPDISGHTSEQEGYTKFQPSSIYHYKTTPTETIEMQINSDGFRDTEDFAKPKPAGTFRIAAMGASSTFGLHDEDDETYPYYLEEMLRERAGIERIEVLNLGIPHLRLNNMVALAEQELPSLEPDVVTLYSGYNNAMVAEDPADVGTLYSFKNWLKGHSVAYRGLHPYVATLYRDLADLFNANLGGTPALDLRVEIDRETIDELRRSMREEYRGYVERLADFVAGLDAQLVLVTQQYTLCGAWSWNLPEGCDTYQSEVAYVESLLEENGRLLAPYSTLLIHRDLMDELRAIAKRRGLPLIEGIDALNRDRARMMASHVHLKPEANARLAEAIHEGLARHGLLPGSGS